MIYNQKWIVPAILPQGGQQIKLGVHPQLIEGHLSARNLTALGQFSGILLKEEALLTPVALFKGVKRPMHERGVDNFVFVYVSNPSCDYRYTRSNTGKPDTLLRPVQSVFVTFVSRAPSMLEDLANSLRVESLGFAGVILGWEWTLASDEGNPHLPDDFTKRYRKCIWRRK